MVVADNADPRTVALPRRSAPPRGHVTVFQRRRIITAAVDVVADLGYERMTVAQVIARARVSRKTFYEVFVDREHCFLAACEDALTQATELASEAYATHGDWSAGIRAALARLLRFLEEEPALARLLIVESPAAGANVSERRARVLDELAGVIEQGRLSSDFPYPPALAGQVLAGGVLTVIHAHLLRERRRPLTDLLGPLMAMIVMPYLGARIAKSELDRPAARSTRRPRRPVGDARPLESLGVRLTYRTMRVLSAMANHPGASNREIAQGSGIVDQGQVSKLLSRLAGLGLAENRAGDGRLGAANEWHLTALGARLEQASRPLR
jgi:AcrR family transcriptional regulator/DNA-binding MarR family transcriptional regulator